jgi:hypothetical protein
MNTDFDPVSASTSDIAFSDTLPADAANDWPGAETSTARPWLQRPSVVAALTATLAIVGTLLVLTQTGAIHAGAAEACTTSVAAVPATPRPAPDTSVPVARFSADELPAEQPVTF